MKRLAAIWVLLLFAAISSAQSPTTGFPPFGSFQGGGFDSVDLYNLNVGFVVPLVSHRGRGTGFNFALAYNSSIWSYNSSASTPTWIAASGWGWAQNPPTGVVTSQRTTFPCIGGTTTWVHNYIYTDSYGTPHPFPVSWSAGSCPVTGTLTGYASDASGYYADISGTGHAPIIRAPDGTKLNYTSVATNPNLMLTDPNGNQITSTVNTTTGETDWIDTLRHVCILAENVPST